MKYLGRVLEVKFLFFNFIIRFSTWFSIFLIYSFLIYVTWIFTTFFSYPFLLLRVPKKLCEVVCWVLFLSLFFLFFTVWIVIYGWPCIYSFIFLYVFIYIWENLIVRCSRLFHKNHAFMIPLLYMKRKTLYINYKHWQAKQLHIMLSHTIKGHGIWNSFILCWY